jgi:FAD/FMN-containing dehydrogenase
MIPNRRTLLCAGLGVTTSFTSGTNGVTTPAQAESCVPLSVSGEFSCDPDVRAAAADDFGHIVHRQPQAVLKPGSSAEISRLMLWAGSEGLKVVARGQGHSTYGRPLIDDGIVIDMSTISSIHRVQPGRIMVDAGATWKSVLEASLAQGLTPPVLTNYLGLSVGGTIAVGGIGGTSSRHGLQTDHVLALDVVTGEGEKLTCSATSNPDLFDAVRAGLAQCGVVTRATLRLMRAPERVRRFQLFYPDLSSLTADQGLVLAEDRFDQLQGALLPDGAGGWRYQLDGAVFYDRHAIPDDDAVLASLSDDRGAAIVTDLTYRDDANAFAKLETMLRANGQWFNPQPWLLTFLPGSNAEQVARESLDGLSSDELGPFGRITYYPMRTTAFRTPLARLPDEEIVFPFNVIRIPVSNDPARVEQAVTQNRVLYDRIRDAGGVQYPVGAFPMSHDDWKDHFGSKWLLLREAKHRYDPGNVLTPGYNVF